MKAVILNMDSRDYVNWESSRQDQRDFRAIFLVKDSTYNEKQGSRPS